MTTKSSNRDCRMAAEQNFFHRWWGSSTICSVTNAIWGMSVWMSSGECRLRGLWRWACKRAGIEDLHFHDLRHEATSRFFEKGLNVMEVAATTGHKDVRMLQRYTHLRAENLTKKLKWDRRTLKLGVKRRCIMCTHDSKCYVKIKFTKKEVRQCV